MDSLFRLQNVRLFRILTSVQCQSDRLVLLDVTVLAADDFDQIRAAIVGLQQIGHQRAGDLGEEL